MEAKPIESRALVVMCASRDVTLKVLAARLGMKPGSLYEYADGTRTPPRWLLEKATLALGYPLHHLDRTLAYLRQGDVSLLTAGSDPRGLAERELDSIALSLGLEWGEVFHDLMHRGKILALAFIERQTAPLLWARLRTHPPEARQAVVREKEEFRSWALSELVSHASIEAASHEAREAVTLAELACVIADCLKDTEPLKLRAQGYARFHRGNALRVQGNLPASDRAFSEAQPIWVAGAAGDPERLLNVARVLGMEASLRREQRRLPEALELLNRSLAVDRGELRAPLLIKRAKTMEEMGNYQEAVTTLLDALPLIDARQLRLLWNVRFNVLACLCRLERYDEAEGLQGATRDLALRLGKTLILARTDWVQGWIHTGQGAYAEAEASFEQARQEFLAQGIAFDAALVSLELVVLYLEQNRTAEVKTLARELLPIFREQQVERECCATVVLFHEAVEQETITLELARRLRNDLRNCRRLQDQKE